MADNDDYDSRLAVGFRLMADDYGAKDEDYPELPTPEPEEGEEDED